MTAAEKEAYLKTMFDDDDCDSCGLSDSEDEDWVPECISKLPVSDNDSGNEELEHSENTERNADEQMEEQQEVESQNSESEEDDEIETAEPEGIRIFFFLIIIEIIILVFYVVIITYCRISNRKFYCEGQNCVE